MIPDEVLDSAPEIEYGVHLSMQYESWFNDFLISLNALELLRFWVKGYIPESVAEAY